MQRRLRHSTFLPWKSKIHTLASLRARSWLRCLTSRQLCSIGQPISQPSCSEKHLVWSIRIPRRSHLGLSSYVLPCTQTSTADSIIRSVAKWALHSASFSITSRWSKEKLSNDCVLTQLRSTTETLRAPRRETGRECSVTLEHSWILTWMCKIPHATLKRQSWA